MQTTAAQFQSERKRQQLLIGLEYHPLYTERAAKTLKMLLDTLIALIEQVKEYEALIDEFTLEDENMNLLKTIHGVGRISRGYQPVRNIQAVRRILRTYSFCEAFE